MNNAFYTGVSGMLAFQEHMNTTAHNIANVSTTGYKAGRSSFSDLLYTEMDVRTPGEKVTGHGTKNGNIDLMMGQSSMMQTNQPLDFAIAGQGYFALQDAATGVTKYTRNGNFTVSPEGNNNYLISRLDGSYVLDGRGRKIALQKDGDGYDYAAATEQLGVYTFDNEYGLGRADGSCFTVTDKSGRAKSITGSDSYELKTSSLENSGVSLADEMLNVIQAQRAFQMNSKIVQTADQIEEMINNLR